MKIFMSRHKEDHIISYHEALHHSMSCHDYHGVPSMKLSEHLFKLVYQVAKSIGCKLLECFI